MDERGLEIKVGALVLAAVAGILGLLFLMGELSLGGKATLKVDFSHAGSVVKHAPVKLGGVVVGRVERVTLTPGRRDGAGQPLMVEMEFSLGSEALSALRQDTAITVATQGPLGEAYLELYPGSAGAPTLDRAKAIRGVDAPRLDLITNRLSGFLESASRVLEDDPRAFVSLINGITGLTTTVNGVLAENRADVRTLASEMAAAAQELRALSVLARTTMAPGGKGAVLLDNASAASRTANDALGGLAAISKDLTAEDGARLRAALAHYAQAGEKIDRLAARGERLLARIEAGEGTAGKVIKDPQLYDDLRALLSDLRKHPWKMLWKE